MFPVSFVQHFVFTFPWFVVPTLFVFFSKSHTKCQWSPLCDSSGLSNSQKSIPAFVFVLCLWIFGFAEAHQCVCLYLSLHVRAHGKVSLLVVFPQMLEFTKKRQCLIPFHDFWTHEEWSVFQALCFYERSKLTEMHQRFLFSCFSLGFEVREKRSIAWVVYSLWTGP